MKAPIDLHPDDAVTRLMLRDLLVHYRHRAGLSQRALGRKLELTQTTIARHEAGQSWMLFTLYRWAPAVGGRLLLRPVGLPDAPDEVQALAAMRPADLTRGHEYTRAALAAELTAARIALGVTREELGEVLGCAESGIRELEAARGDTLLGTVQRHCRALGGALWIGLEPLPVEQMAAA